MEAEYAFPGPIFKGCCDLPVPPLGVAQVNLLGKSLPFQKGFMQHITIYLQSRVSPQQYL